MFGLLAGVICRVLGKRSFDECHIKNTQQKNKTQQSKPFANCNGKNTQQDNKTLRSKTFAECHGKNTRQRRATDGFVDDGPTVDPSSRCLFFFLSSMYFLYFFSFLCVAFFFYFCFFALISFSILSAFLRFLLVFS